MTKNSTFYNSNLSLIRILIFLHEIRIRESLVFVYPLYIVYPPFKKSLLRYFKSVVQIEPKFVYCKQKQQQHKRKHDNQNTQQQQQQ